MNRSGLSKLIAEFNSTPIMIPPDASFAPILQVWLVALSSIFFLVDPLAAIPTFLIIAGADDRQRQHYLARRACTTCFVVLFAFAVSGRYIFRMYGITLPAFELAGGLILLLIGLDMLQARRSPTHEIPAETQDAAQKADASVIPLGIPVLAGPGAISTVMVLISQSNDWTEAVPVFVAIGVTSLASYFILAQAARITKVFGRTGIRILTRLMGLLLTAIAMQFFLNGLRASGLLSPK